MALESSLNFENNNHKRPNDDNDEGTKPQPKRKKQKLMMDFIQNNNYSRSNRDASNEPSTSKASPYFSNRQHGSQDISTAFSCKNYASVLQYLKKDQEYPKNFKMKDIENTKEGKDLRRFATVINKIHRLVSKNDVEELKKITPIENMKLYLNFKNQSALYVAIIKKSFQAYGYLISIKADFKDKNESKAKRRLPLESKVSLDNVISQNASSIEKPHIHFLMSNSKYMGENSNKVTVKAFYESIDKIPEISIMLQVLQHFNGLRIMFDFDRENVNHIASGANEQDRGLSYYKEGKVFIAAKFSATEDSSNNADAAHTNNASAEKRVRNKVLGTTAHECTHMALEIVFGDDCNPYKNADEEEKLEFQEIIKRTKNLPVICKPSAKNVSKNASKVIANVFETYKKDELPSELIAAVPQLLAEDENNRNWLDENVPDLMAYYRKIVSKCEEFVKKGSSNIFKKNIESFNRTEIDNLLNLKILFKDVKKHDFLNMNDKNIFIVHAENTKLSLLRTFQKLYGKDFCKYADSFIVFKFSRFLKNRNDIADCLRSVDVKAMIIEFESTDFNDRQINNGMEQISGWLKDRPTLKIVLVVLKTEERVRTSLKGKCKMSTIIESTDDNFSLNNLDDESIDNVLQKEILFQGKEMKLGEMIDTDRNLFKRIDVKVLGCLCSDEILKIGGSVSGTSNLEGAYTDIVENINLNVFCNRLKSASDPFIVIIHGLIGKNKKEQLHKLLKEQYLHVNMKDHLCEEYRLSVFNGKKILFTEYELANDDFRDFCRVNSHQKIYLINLTYHYEDSNPTFMLKQFFNPNFYVERKFKLNVVKKAKTRKDLITPYPSEKFIISNAKVKNVEAPNLHYLDESEAREKFEEFASRNEIVHWFSNEDNSLVWKNSNQSIANIRKFITNSSKLNNEKNIIKDIGTKKVVLIADDPGMGKSTSLTKLYENKIDNQSISEKNWVIRINLREHVETIKAINTEDFDNKKLIGFLTEVDKNLKNDLNPIFLQLAISSESFLKPLLIVFDGFDEISSESERGKIKFVLKYLKKSTKCKAWVTTRLNFKLELENELSTFAVEFEPIDDRSKRFFIKNYLKHRLDLFLNESQTETSKKNVQLNNFTNELVNKLKNIFVKESEKFIGTPLQLYLILGNSVDSYKSYACHKSRNPDLSFLGNNLIHIYSKFLEMKFDVFFKKHNFSIEQTREILKDSFYNFNKNFAESIIFKVDHSEFLEKHKSLMLATGIVKSTGESIEFIHFTFGDYHSAEVIMAYLKNEGHRKLGYDLIDVLIQEIFLKQDYKLLRDFISLHLEGMDLDADLPHENLTSLGKFMKWLWGRNPSAKDKKGTVYGVKGTALHVAFEEKNLTLFKFLIHCCKKLFSKEQFYNLFMATNSTFNTIFHIVATIKDATVCQYLFEQIKSLDLSRTSFKELLECKNKSGRTAFELAKWKKFTEVAKIIEAEGQ